MIKKIKTRTGCMTMRTLSLEGDVEVTIERSKKRVTLIRDIDDDTREVEVTVDRVQHSTSMHLSSAELFALSSHLYNLGKELARCK